MTGQLVAAISLAVLAALVLTACWLVLRRQLITRPGGVVECGLRSGAGGPWRHGLAAYEDTALSWYWSGGLHLRPQVRLRRADITITGTRQPAAAEAGYFGPGVVVVRCSAGLQPPVELAMSRPAYTGLLAWLESSPQFRARAGG